MLQRHLCCHYTNRLYNRYRRIWTLINGFGDRRVAITPYTYNGFSGNRTHNLSLKRRLLCLLSYKPLTPMAGLEPATRRLTAACSTNWATWIYWVNAKGLEPLTPGLEDRCSNSYWATHSWNPPDRIRTCDISVKSRLPYHLATGGQNINLSFVWMFSFDHNVSPFCFF